MIVLVRVSERVLNNYVVTGNVQKPTTKQKTMLSFDIEMNILECTR